MRISPATAKYKLSASGPPVEFESALDVPETSDQQLDPTPSPSLNSQAQSVSAPLATNQANSQVTSTSSTSTPPGQSRSYETPSEDRKAPNGSNNGITRTPSNNNSLGATSVGKPEQQPAQRYVISEESWKHHAQARAILSNLIGPNGEQLSSSDPYNTTVFVGGLSPLISEDTLRTFFVPFGEIHYVSIRRQIFFNANVVFRLRFLLGRTVDLFSLSGSRMPSGQSRRCKASQLEVVGYG